MTTINHVTLYGIPDTLSKRMVILKPTRGYQGRPLKTWNDAIKNLVMYFWGLGADCTYTFEAKAVLDDNPYDAVVEIAPNGWFAVRRV